MTVIQEQYIKDETYTLAIKVGFGASARHTRQTIDAIHPDCTQQLLAAWLRTVHNLHLAVNFDQNTYWYEYKILSTVSKNPNIFMFGFEDHDQAMEAGLQEALNYLQQIQPSQ